MKWLFILPLIILAQTATPSATVVPTLTQTPTSIPTVNPISNLFLTEISPTSDTEWVEIYNANEYQVTLTKWKLKTETTTRNIPDNTVIAPKSYYLFNSTNFLSDSVPKTVYLVDQNGVQIDTASIYPANLDNGLSWAKQSDILWCQSIPSSNQPNSSCYTSPTLTPTTTPSPTNTTTPSPVPTSTKTPTSTPTSTPTPIPSPTQTISKIPTQELTPFVDVPLSTGTILAVSVNYESTPESKFNHVLSEKLPLIFITLGGILLTVPLIIPKFKKI